MNNIHFWLEKSPRDNILFYNAKIFDKNDLFLSVDKTKSNIIFIYNLYSTDQEKLDIIKEKNTTHYFFFKKEGDNIIDPGILILSLYPIIIYSSEVYQKISKRIAKLITFTINKYMFKIKMNPSLETDGYDFHFIYIVSENKIAHSVKKITSKIILLKSG